MLSQLMLILGRLKWVISIHEFVRRGGKEEFGGFHRMGQEEIKVDEVTLITMLHACSH